LHPPASLAATVVTRRSKAEGRLPNNLNPIKTKISLK
jgi:hypothetical protein